MSDPIPEELSLLSDLLLASAPSSHLLALVALGTHHAHLTDGKTEEVPRTPSRPLHIMASLFKSKAWASQNFLCRPELVSKVEREAWGPMLGPPQSLPGE